MILADVEYELFDWEARQFDANPQRGFDELNYQLRLVLAGGQILYVAWQVGIWRDYAWVAVSERSFCRPPPEETRRASGLSRWQPLIGRRIELVYLDRNQQGLAIRSGDAAVYCYTLSGDWWGADTLRITSQYLTLPTSTELPHTDRG